MGSGRPTSWRRVVLSLVGLLAAREAAAADGYGVGNIAGTITYPGEAVPALRIYAIATDGKLHRSLITPPDERRFTIEDIPVGQYHVVAYPYEKKEGGLPAVAWTRAARCVKGPCDHSLVVVNVVAARTANGVLLADWYVPPELLPPDPAKAKNNEAPLVDCEKEPDTASRDRCHQRRHELADKEINRHYERVMKSLAPYPKCHEELRNAQLAWLRFRDQHCAFEGTSGGKGRLIRCLREVSEARAAYMQAQSPIACGR
jgi:uncharacterized protein YecT (DUF1311 family)